MAILELQGLGTSAWSRVDAAAHVDAERRAWDSRRRAATVHSAVQSAIVVDRLFGDLRQALDELALVPVYQSEQGMRLLELAKSRGSLPAVPDGLLSEGGTA